MTAPGVAVYGDVGDAGAFRAAASQGDLGASTPVGNTGRAARAAARAALLAIDVDDGRVRCMCAGHSGGELLAASACSRMSPEARARAQTCILPALPSHQGRVHQAALEHRKQFVLVKEQCLQSDFVETADNKRPRPGQCFVLTTVPGPDELVCKRCKEKMLKLYCARVDSGRETTMVAVRRGRPPILDADARVRLQSSVTWNANEAIEEVGRASQRRRCDAGAVGPHTVDAGHGQPSGTSGSGSVAASSAARFQAPDGRLPAGRALFASPGASNDGDSVPAELADAPAAARRQQHRDAELERMARRAQDVEADVNWTGAAMVNDAVDMIRQSAPFVAGEMGLHLDMPVDAPKAARRLQAEKVIDLHRAVRRTRDWCVATLACHCRTACRV